MIPSLYKITRLLPPTLKDLSLPCPATCAVLSSKHRTSSCKHATQFHSGGFLFMPPWAMGFSLLCPREKSNTSNLARLPPNAPESKVMVLSPSLPSFCCLQLEAVSGYQLLFCFVIQHQAPAMIMIVTSTDHELTSHHHLPSVPRSEKVFGSHEALTVFKVLWQVLQRQRSWESTEFTMYLI